MVMMNMMSSTSITSISGVVFISPMGWELSAMLTLPRAFERFWQESGWIGHKKRGGSLRPF